MIDVSDVAKKVGLMVLLLALWVISAFALNAVLLIFLGVVTLPLSGFGVLHPPSSITGSEMSGVAISLYVITSTISIAVGGYFATTLVIFRDNIDELNKRFEYVGRGIVWMLLTCLLGFAFMFVVIVIYGFLSGSSSGSDEAFQAILQDARYVLLAALIGAGELARRELLAIENEPNSANEDFYY